ncbi:MmgE/PrpD family protein [Streptomyces sp. ISL-43]|uniref:MmgE/PrpD family protein n=1 Tax=Streptomyces sp. ISL-43 TaxID=2819183 RepID=UPI001BED20DC|nr:MmgE/PrpD family protein [Streptomyces sp. ISL-43]MBT2450010.1 MmgE/PrpD family protein [Streptomyces sp. ISL-43]
MGRAGHRAGSRRVIARGAAHGTPAPEVTAASPTRRAAGPGRPAALAELARWAAGLRPQDVPERLLSLAASQLLSQLASIRAGAEQPLGRRMVQAFGPPFQDDPRTSACVLAGLGSWLNLDDTAYAGHLSNSTVAVPLAYAHHRGLDGAALLTAIVAANECAARVTAAATLGPLRGQSALHTHLVGATAGRLHCEGADADTWTNALGLALAMPPWPLMRAFLASDARLFNAFSPVRTAMDACDAATAGFQGPADLLEHPDGFLARFATVPLVSAVTDGLGERWHTDTLSFKMHPGGPGVDAAIDCALDLHRELAIGRPDNATDTAGIDEIVVETSLYTLAAQRTAERYVDGPGAPLGALVLHTPYTVATALLTGDLTVADFTAPRRDEESRWRTARRVRLVHDPAMTRALLTSEAPFGEAVRQAGSDAEDWLHGFGGPELVELAAAVQRPEGPAGFTRASKLTGARVSVRLSDGRTATRERMIPLGAAGPHTRQHHARLMRQKFTGLGGPHHVAEAVAEVGGMSPAALRTWTEAALS